MVSKSTVKPVLQYVIAYLFWIVVAIVGFWLLFQLRSNLLSILAIVLEDPDTYQDSRISRAIDRWFVVVAGAIWLFCITFLEGYFRDSVPRKLLWSRIRHVVVIMAIMAGASLGLQFIL